MSLVFYRIQSTSEVSRLDVFGVEWAFLSRNVLRFCNISCLRDALTVK